MIFTRRGHLCGAILTTGLTLCAVIRSASGDAVSGVFFTDGSVLVNGSASSPAGSSSAVAPGTVTPTTVTGGGSTGSGLVSGLITLDGGIVVGSDETFINLDGIAQASQPAGYDGFATINLGFVDPRFASDPIIFTLPQAAFYDVWNRGQQTVTLTAVTGTVGATTLSAGTYRLTMSFGVTISAPQSFVEKTLDWTLRLSTGPLTNLPADLNTDGVVNAADLATLLAAWGTANADIDGDGSTAASDLAVLLAAWDSL